MKSRRKAKPQDLLRDIVLDLERQKERLEKQLALTTTMLVAAALESGGELVLSREVLDVAGKARYRFAGNDDEMKVVAALPGASDGEKS